MILSKNKGVLLRKSRFMTFCQAEIIKIKTAFLDIGVLLKMLLIFSKSRSHFLDHDDPFSRSRRSILLSNFSLSAIGRLLSFLPGHFQNVKVFFYFHGPLNFSPSFYQNQGNHPLHAHPFNQNQPQKYSPSNTPIPTPIQKTKIK